MPFIKLKIWIVDFGRTVHMFEIVTAHNNLG